MLAKCWENVWKMKGKFQKIGKMLTKYWQNVGKMLTKCWQNEMQGKCQEDVGKILAKCW